MAFPVLKMVRIKDDYKCNLIIILSDDNDDDIQVSKLNAGATIGGAVGGAVLSVIICGFCMVVFWMRRSFSNLFNNREGTKLDSDIKVTSDSSYDTIKHIVYDYELFKYSETNPSYGMIQEYNRLVHNSDNAVQSQSNDATQPNLSYSGNSQSSVVLYEGLDGYIKTDLTGVKGTHYYEIIGPTTQEENSTVNDIATTDATNTNPSYNLMSRGVILEDNPSYNK